MGESLGPARDCRGAQLCVGTHGEVPAVCRPPQALGGACDPAVAVTGCFYSLACDSDTRKCVPLPGLGSACWRNRCGPTPGVRCDPATSMCVAAKLAGDRCGVQATPTSECVDGFCNAEFKCAALPEILACHIP